MRTIFQFSDPRSGNYVYAESQELVTAFGDGLARQNWERETDFEVVGALQRENLNERKARYELTAAQYGESYADEHVASAKLALDQVLARARLLVDRGFDVYAARFRADVRRPRALTVYESVEELLELGR